QARGWRARNAHPAFVQARREAHAVGIAATQAAVAGRQHARATGLRRRRADGRTARAALATAAGGAAFPGRRGHDRLTVPLTSAAAAVNSPPCAAPTSATNFPKNS